MTPRLPSLAVWLRILIPAALVGVPAIALLGTVRDRIDVPLAPDTRGWPARSIPLGVTVGRDGLSTGRLILRDAVPTRLLAEDEIRLLMATLRSRPHLVRGELRFDGTTCVYSTRPGSELADNEYLSFYRAGGCEGAAPRPGHPIRLEVVFDGGEAVHLWTYAPAARDLSEPMLEVAAVPTMAGTRPVVRGRLVRPGLGGGRPRIALLRYVWQVSPRATWIWAVLILAGCLTSAGAFAFPWSATTAEPGWRVAARAGLAGACFAASLGLQYAVLVPPLQAPDEADHLLSYASVVHDERVAAQAPGWARLGHFQRLKFHSDEAFRPADIGNPFPVAWDAEIFAERTDLRSPTTAAAWEILARPLAGVSVPRVLLTIRAVNVLLFALAVGLACALITRLATGPFRQLGLLPFVLVPTLPFFAMHVSEFSLLTAAYVLLAASLAVLVHDGPRSHVVGLPLGMASALAAATGRSAWPMAILVAFVLVGRAFLGSRDEDRLRSWAGWVFWGGFAAGASMLLALVPTFTRNLGLIMREASQPGLASAGFLNRSAWWILALPLMGVGLEIGFLAIRRRLRWRWPSRLMAVVGLAGAAAIGGLLAVSAFVELPKMHVIEGAALPAASDYTRLVLTVMGTSFRLGEPDFLLVTSFWTGFGWLDTLPDGILAEVLVASSSLAAVALLVAWSIRQDGRRLGYALLFVTGLAVTLGAYAVMSLLVQRNLHGRYLVGWYLSALAVVWSVVWLERPARWRVPAVTPPRTIVLLGACGVIHAYCLFVILGRYFQ